LGTPTEWPDGERLANRREINFPRYEKVSLSNLMPNACRDAIDLMEWMLEFNPKKRPDCT